MRDICDDLAAEWADLDSVVGDLGESEWDRATPAEGWIVRDQISHLAFFDERAALSIRDPDAFVADATQGMQDPEAFMSQHIDRGRTGPAAELLGWWRTARAELLELLRPLDPGTRLLWYGPPMAARSFATARLMETWAHGQDVVDAVGATRPPTDRLRHVCHIGVRAMPYAYRVHGLEPPETPIRVELTSPGGGDTWTWGEADVADRITGPALDFALLATQRRHRADLDVRAEGEVADQFLDIIQAFAGPAGPGRPPSTENAGPG